MHFITVVSSEGCGHSLGQANSNSMFGHQGNAAVLELYLAFAHHFNIEVLQNFDDR